MAETKITDIIVPEVFLPYMLERTAELSELITSGVIENDAEFDTRASGGGKTVEMPFWQDLTGDDEVLSDSGALTVGNITTAQDTARIHQRGKAFGANDLARLLSGDDPMAAIATLLAEYRNRRIQAQLISTLQGVFAAASMSGNLSDIHQVSGAPDSSHMLTAETFINATQLMGDNKTKLTAILMHSAVESHLKKLDLIDYVPGSEQGQSITVFQGHRVIIDDSIDTVTVDSKTVYSSYLFGAGAIALGNSNQNEPVDGGFGTWQLEFGRTGLAGETWLANRWRNIMHPRGIAWQESAIAGASPTNAEIAEAAQWVRKYEAKNVRIVKVKHNIAA
tara:strand:- start:7368 stop:8375 length:1008 start_codon:yes stop_codon:yes gene_type:complete